MCVFRNGVYDAAKGYCYWKASGSKPPLRTLTPQERELLESGPMTVYNDGTREPDLKNRLFKDSIDYDKVRIQRSADHGRTIGSTIYLPDEFGGLPLFDPNGNLTAEGQRELAHEAAHVWQNQNGSPLAVSAERAGAHLGALWDSLWGGPPDSDYQWTPAANQGDSFDQLSPEQQAELVRHYEMGDIPEGLQDYAEKAMDQIRRKQGAPKLPWQ